MRRRGFLTVAAALAATLPAPAYYHFIHYLTSGNAPEKFDLATLPGRTVTFFVSGDGPTVLTANDTANSVLSQIRQAALTWNGVPSSSLRVAFGGLSNASTPQNTPGGDVVFEDLPPGVYGFGGPSSTAVPVTPAGAAPFVPITRSTIHLNANLTLQPGPSYRETFFLTTVHEMGHALGLQHTFTSATMSQATTRATTLSHPLDVDDIAGISVLYPGASFAQLGSISGRITTGARGAHLTSVVAIRAGGGAVSALTNTDGVYRIEGIPPGQYFVYAHALPGDADIRGPWAADGKVVASSGPTDALFYPGTRNLQQAQPVSVNAGKVVPNIDMSLPGRTSLPIYDTQVFGYFNNYTIAAQPAYVNMLGASSTVVASGPGLGSNGQAPGLSVQVFGGSSYVRSGGIRPYASGAYTYIALDLGFNLGASPGPQHMVFTTPSFLHVLPAAIILTQNAPPLVNTVSENADGSLTVTGANWTGESQIYFDGFPAATTSLDLKTGTAVVVPPPGSNRQTATLTVYNSDGQNSQLVQSGAPVTYTYGDAATPLIASVSPASLPAGAEAAVDITVANMNLSPGLLTVGFGSSDIAVRRVFVLSPTQLRVNVSIAPGASLSNPDVSVISGFQLATAPAGFQIQPAVPGLPLPEPMLFNALAGLTNIYAGAIVSLYGSALTAPGATPVITFDGQTAPILYASATQINLQVPRNLAPGLVTMKLNNGAEDGYPLAINIDTQPASIAAVQAGTGEYVDATHPIQKGNLYIVGLTGFATVGSAVDNGRVQISLGGVMHTVVSVTPVAGGAHQVAFIPAAAVPAGASQMIVYLDGRSSYPASLPVAP